jgi:type I restriction enzyme S subunit
MSAATTHIKTEKQLVPALRFNEFDIEWEKKKLGDVGKIRMCKRIFNSDTTEVGDIPFYKIGTFGKQANAYISNELYLDYRERFSFPKIGDILMSASGTLGRTVIYDGSPSYYQDSNIVWIDNEEEVITNSFLFYIYQIVRYDSEGGTIQRLYNSIINKAKFSKPSLPEQQKIASFLSAVDEKIQQLIKKKDLFEQYKKGVMQQLFSGQLRFKDENGNPYPDWEEKALGEICSDVTYGLTVRPAFVDNGIPLLSAREISKGFINYESAPMISQEDFDNLSNKAKPVIGDLFLSKTGSIGFSALVKKNIIAAITQNIAIIRIRNKELYSANFILQYFKTRQFLKLAIAKVNQSTIMDLQLGDIKKLPLPDMAFDEQQKIATYLSRIDTKLESVNNQITQTQTFKKGLLQQMFV